MPLLPPELIWDKRSQVGLRACKGEWAMRPCHRCRPDSVVGGLDIKRVSLGFGLREELGIERHLGPVTDVAVGYGQEDRRRHERSVVDPVLDSVNLHAPAGSGGRCLHAGTRLGKDPEHRRYIKLAAVHQTQRCGVARNGERCVW